MRYHQIEIVIRIYLFAAALFNVAKSEFFTAMSELQTLIHTEGEVAKALEKYVEMEEARLKKVKRLSKQYTELYNAASKDEETFLANPVNAYLLVKHLTADWNTTKELVSNFDSRTVMMLILMQELNYPDDGDLKGAVNALIRLQDTYLLNTTNIAQSRIESISPTIELTANDCFEMGRQAFYSKFPNYALEWLHESLNRIDEEEADTVNRTEVMEYMAYAAYDAYNFTLGMKITQDIVKLDPGYPRTYENLLYYQIKQQEWKNKKAQVGNTENETDIFAITVAGRIWTDEEISIAYDKLCRGESLRTRKLESKLFCHYTTNNNGYFVLQPVKVEVLSLKPRIVMYHDVISDKEANRIKEIATNRLQRAVVQDTITGEIETTTDRISKSTNVASWEHKDLRKIDERIEDLTGLSISTSEELHVVNYGIGGHYLPHFDFAQAAEKIEMFQRLGNRIATWIFYLTDVAAGGSTVFPTVGVEVKPRKGSAAFWYNLFENGQGDKGTLHAACPVLAGSKWVANKWFHERDQEFRRLCSLDPRE